MHTPPNEQSQRKQRNTPKNTAPFEARTSLGSRKKIFFCDSDARLQKRNIWVPAGFHQNRKTEQQRAIVKSVLLEI